MLLLTVLISGELEFIIVFATAKSSYIALYPDVELLTPMLVNLLFKLLYKLRNSTVMFSNLLISFSTLVVASSTADLVTLRLFSTFLALDKIVSLSLVLFMFSNLVIAFFKGFLS